MIELERHDENDPTGFYGVLWTDESNTHVIVEEGAHLWVRDESGDVGVANELGTALELARAEWGEVTLAPARRLRDDIELGRSHAVADFLLEYLAEYGAVGIDVKALAQTVLERQEEE